MESNLFFKRIVDAAKAKKHSIVLPEGHEERVLEAAYVINKEGIAKIIILGDEQRIADAFASKKWSFGDITVINPETAGILQEYARIFYELRKTKGMTPELALKTVRQVNYFGVMMVQTGTADGLVSGAAHSTADTVRPALQIIKGAKANATVSGFFIIDVHNRPYLFADCALMENPTPEQLADIAVNSAVSAMKYGIPPKVALLSYSSYGSGRGKMSEKVSCAVALAKEKIAAEYAESDILVDGELQADAAIVPEVARKKVPGSPVGGEARVLIFPDLNAANIGYKLVQHFVGTGAYGPILQGLRKPVNDLSRGCRVEDIIGTVALTALQVSN